jgi:hypothetical protein
MFGRKLVICTVPLTLLALFALNVTSFLFVSEAQTTTTLYVDPALTIVRRDTTFSLNISVDAVKDLCSWQVYVYFLNQILEATDCVEGPFLKSHGPTMFDGGFNNNYNGTHGQLWMYCLRAWSGIGVNGSGTLATITFKSKSGGSSAIILEDTILGNSTAQRIFHVTKNGMVEVAVHDIAVTNVNPLKIIEGQGLNMHINVTVENQGDVAETFNITSYANTTLIQTKTVTLEKGASTTLTFTWNTTGFAKGNYTIKAYAWPLPNETDIADNTFISPIAVHVVMPGDGDADGDIDIYDIVMITSIYGSKKGQPNYNPNLDWYDDAVINIYDVVVATSNYGQQDP